MTRVGNSIRVGVIGAGYVAEERHLPVLVRMPDVKVAWICDLDRQRAARLAHLHRIREVQQEIDNCSDVDIALITVPVGYRQPVVDKVFDRRWHAFIEKPFATSCMEHDRILERAGRCDVEVGVGFQRRLYAGTQLAQQVVQRSLFGPVKRIYATEGFSLGSETPGVARWSTNRTAAGGGVMIETACHLIDQVFTICGVENFDLEYCDLLYQEDIDFEGKTAGELHLGNGATCRFNIAVSWLGDLYNAVVIEFALARLMIPIIAADPVITDLNGNHIARLVDPRSAGQVTVDEASTHAAYSQWHAFIRQCHSRRPSLVAAADSRLTTKFIEECYRRRPPRVDNWNRASN